MNAEVRANATLLFTEAFPVHDPSMSSDRVDELVQKQLDTLFVSPAVHFLSWDDLTSCLWAVHQNSDGHFMFQRRVCVRVRSKSVCAAGGQ